jgi:putative ABC transport system ATP-binding protein
VHRPRVVLADEPTGNLDPQTARQVLDLFAAQLRDTHCAAILITHSERVADSADRVLRLDAGALHAVAAHGGRPA